MPGCGLRAEVAQVFAERLPTVVDDLVKYP